MNTNQELNQKVKRAFTAATPDILDSVLSDCEKQKGASTMKKTTSIHRPLKAILAVTAAMVILLGGAAGVYTNQMNRTVASTVMLDVNPSLEILLNKKETVLKVIGHNDEAREVIGDMDFSGSSLDVTVNALIGSMLRNGYISEISNSILISVEGKDPAESAALQAKLTEEINKLLQTGTFTGAVLSQTVSADEKLQKIADTYGITLGKAQLIQQIINQNPIHTFEELVPLSINELNLISSSDSAPLEQVDSVGTASEKAYIGNDKALEIALTEAGVTIDNITDLSLEMDYEQSALIYEVEFHCGDQDYEYCIHAGAGSVLHHEREFCDDNDHHGQGYHGGHHSGGNNPGNGGQPTASISDADAKSIALAHAGAAADNISNYECKLDYDDGILCYEIEFCCNGYNYEYDIHAENGAILKSDKELCDDDDHRHHQHQAGNGAQTGQGNSSVSQPTEGQTASSQPTASISDADAKSIALAHAGAAADSIYDYKCELDDDDGVPVYEIEFSSGGFEYEYEIDAASGAIIESNKEKDD